MSKFRKLVFQGQNRLEIIFKRFEMPINEVFNHYLSEIIENSFENKVFEGGHYFQKFRSDFSRISNFLNPIFEPSSESKLYSDIRMHLNMQLE